MGLDLPQLSYRSSRPHTVYVGGLSADVDKKILSLAKRDWGKIFLEGVEVTSFSHDRRLNNAPFGGIIEWPENDDHNAVRRWSHERWRKFFLGRVAEEMNDNKETALSSQRTAAAQIDFAEQVLSRLPPQ